MMREFFCGAVFVVSYFVKTCYSCFIVYAVMHFMHGGMRIPAAAAGDVELGRRWVSLTLCIFLARSNGEWLMDTCGGVFISSRWPLGCCAANRAGMVG